LNDKTFNSGSSDCGVRVRIFPRDNDVGAPSEQP
jgi:hypothetical protein